MKVNLLEDSEKENIFAINIFMVALVIFISIIILSSTGVYFFYIQNINIIEGEIESLSNQIDNYSEQAREYSNLQSEISELKEKLDIREIKYYPWGEALLELGYIISEDVMLNKININSSSLNLEGLAATEENVIQFINNLNNSVLFTNIELEDLDKKDEVEFIITAEVYTGG